MRLLLHILKASRGFPLRPYVSVGIILEQLMGGEGSYSRVVKKKINRINNKLYLIFEMSIASTGHNMDRGWMKFNLGSLLHHVNTPSQTSPIHLCQMSGKRSEGKTWFLLSSIHPPWRENNPPSDHSPFSRRLSRSPTPHTKRGRKASKAVKAKSAFRQFVIGPNTVHAWDDSGTPDPPSPA